MKKKRRVRPHVFTIRPDSDQAKLRLACVLAYQKLDWSGQQELDRQADEILRLMKRTRI